MTDEEIEQIRIAPTKLSSINISSEDWCGEKNKIVPGTKDFQKKLTNLTKSDKTKKLEILVNKTVKNAEKQH